LYADEQATIAVTEGELQMEANKLNKIIKKYGIKISLSKTKAFRLCEKTYKFSNWKLKKTIIKPFSQFN
jgi:hypothetical protein